MCRTGMYDKEKKMKVSKHCKFTVPYPKETEVHTPSVIPTRANVLTTRARARAFDVWYTADTFLLEMRNLCLFATDRKSPPEKPQLRAKNGRIDFSSLVWDKGIALSGVTSVSLKVHSCSPMSL